jgi:hypothetical protein
MLLAGGDLRFFRINSNQAAAAGGGGGGGL